MSTEKASFPILLYREYLSKKAGNPSTAGKVSCLKSHNSSHIHNFSHVWHTEYKFCTQLDKSCYLLCMKILHYCIIPLLKCDHTPQISSKVLWSFLLFFTYLQRTCCKNFFEIETLQVFKRKHRHFKSAKILVSSKIHVFSLVARNEVCNLQLTRGVQSQMLIICYGYFFLNTLYINYSPGHTMCDPVILQISVIQYEMLGCVICSKVCNR